MWESRSFRDEYLEGGLVSDTESDSVVSSDAESDSMASNEAVEG